MNNPIKIISLLWLVNMSLGTALFAQTDSTTQINQDAIYTRPFIGLGQSKTAVGGYMELNTNYFSENGISEGFSTELRRFNIFLYSQIGNKIKFLSEIEFEPSEDEITIETALLDFQFNSSLNLRAGILLPAIGLVNTNHDSPNWEFVERPLSSTEIIPTTLSEVGFGLFGRFYPGINTVLSYDAYVVNGLQDGIILNEEGKTHIPSGKSHEMFGEDNNGTPMFNGRIGLTDRRIGEVGIAWYGGVYNTYRIEGVDVEEKRRLSLAAIDFKLAIKKLTLQGEWVIASIDVPDDIREIYGDKQTGGFVDFIYPIFNGKFLGFQNSEINASLRLERVDLNSGSFETNISGDIGDENNGIAFGLGWRPASGTIVRFNYSYHWVHDNLGNPPDKIAGYQIGIASYF